jgi:hypothetical protein
MFQLKSLKVIVIVGCGALIAGVLACSAGSQGGSSGGDGGVTQPPAEQATSDTSGGASASDPLETMDPCSVVPQDDVSAFFGAPSDAGTPGSKGSPTFCLYAAADQTGHLSVNMSYTAAGALGSDDYIQFSAGSPTVPGLGDGAFYIPGGQGIQGDILYVAKGGWLIHMSGGTSAGLATGDQLKPLAQAALAHLP